MFESIRFVHRVRNAEKSRETVISGSGGHKEPSGSGRKTAGEMRALTTRWGRELADVLRREESAGRVLPLNEYPRPLMQREKWENLNGLWDYAIVKKDDLLKNIRWEGKILVPFSPESSLSGVGRQLQPSERLIYHRILPVRAVSESSRYLLHFGAVDQSCAVYVNGKRTALHRGGYTPFTADITDKLRVGENHLTVCVRDVSDTSFYARGKQKLSRGGMYYTAQSGIWQTVFMEKVPEHYIASAETAPDPENGSVRFKVRVRQGTGRRVHVRIFAPGMYADREFDKKEAEVIRDLSLKEETDEAAAEVVRDFSLKEEPDETAVFAGETNLPEKQYWSPESPWLYYYEVCSGEDTVTGYFALRSFTIERDRDGIPRFCLNHKPCFLRGVLDQGYWPDGLYTAPSDEALLFDILEMKQLGFNMVRKHAKTEAERWYYHCDRIGLIVWQDIVNGGTPYADWFVTYLATFLNWTKWHISDRFRRLLSRSDPAGRAQFETEMKETVSALRMHPSIAAWTLFNEGWGQFDTVRLTGELRNMDPDRLIDSASGWFDQGCGDFISIHHYFLPLPWRADGRRAVVLSEIGGYALHDDAHSACENTYGYRMYETGEELTENIRTLLEKRETLTAKGLCGFVYTQWSDIEEEVNGIYTYDREVLKVIPPVFR